MYLQKQPKAYGGGATDTIAPVTPYTAGSLGILAFAHQTGTNFTISDGVNTWVRVVNDVGTTTPMTIWYCLSLAAGAPTITVTAGVGVSGNMILLEYDSNNGALDGTPASAAYSSVDPVTSPTITTAGNYTLILGFVCEFSNGASNTVSAPWFKRYDLGNTNNIIVLEYKAPLPVTTQSFTFTFGSAGMAGGVAIMGFTGTADKVRKLFISGHRPAPFKLGNAQ